LFIFKVTPEEEKNAPTDTFLTTPAKGKEFEGFNFRIQSSVLDCTGCGVCVDICPAKCLKMEPLETVV
jgi:pyruvate-ferredoxin/flavodoxin oxidoreductase